MPPDTPKRLIASLVISVVMVVFIAMTAKTPSDGSAQEATLRAPLLERLGESMIILHDYGRTIKLRDGRAEFPVQDNDAYGPKIVATLSHIAKKTNAMRPGEMQAREYVFSTLVMTEPGVSDYTYLLMFEDNGRALSYIASAALAPDITVLGIDIALILDRGDGDFRVRVLAQSSDRVGAARPEKIFLFRVTKTNDKLVREGEPNE